VEDRSQWKAPSIDTLEGHQKIFWLCDWWKVWVRWPCWKVWSHCLQWQRQCSSDDSYLWFEPLPWGHRHGNNQSLY
jgi:hypothetical protein